jgi:hypothetical protein
MSRLHVTRLPETTMPTRLSLLWLLLRVTLLQAQRSLHNAARPVAPLQRGYPAVFPHVVASSRTPLYTAKNPAERPLELGKVQNLRVAARRLNGLVIPGGNVFSFWTQLGRCTRRRGFVAGRQLQEGCLMPAVGGGICQLSNALYDVALQAGCRIIERHPHTRIVPGSAASRDRDATVAWNHIDLRWAPDTEMYLAVELTAIHLVVELRAASPRPAQPAAGRMPLPTPQAVRQLLDPAAHSCGTCERTDCVMFHKGVVAQTAPRTAALVDEYWPEFDAYLRRLPGADTELHLPLDGTRHCKPGYAWTTAGYRGVHEAKYAALRRSIRSRRLAEQGAARQQSRLQSFTELARAYSRRIGPEVTHLVVALDLLPFLWREGVLGGRTFDVLLTRLPISELQARLDAELARHPERGLLGDFRAPAELLRDEAAALAAARWLVTPHRDFAVDDPRRLLLDWQLPPAPAWTPGAKVVFPGPTVARKGAYELREAARRLGLTVVPLGSDLEAGGSFWDGIGATADGHWLDGAAVVVQPAVLEDKPRRLLQALAAGCPVICTPGCGLAGMSRVTTVPVGDVEALTAALAAVLDFKENQCAP